MDSVQTRGLAAIAVLIAAIFLLDRILPPGVSASVLYVLPVMLTLSLRSTEALTAVTMACLLATILDPFLELDPEARRSLWSNDFLALIAEMTTASLVYRQIRLVESERRAFARIESKQRRLALMHSVASATSGSLDLHSVLKSVAESVAKLFSAEMVLIWLADEGGKKLRLAFHSSPAASDIEDRFHSIRWETSPLAVAEAIRRRRIIIAGEGAAPPSDSPEIPDALGEKRAVLVPLFARKRLVGALTIAMKTTPRLRPDDSAVLETVGRQIAIAIENARLFEDTSKQRERLALINQIGEVFASTLDLGDIYLSIREMLSRLIDCETLLISFYYPSDQSILCAFAYTDGEVLPVEQFEPLKLGVGPQSECIRTARPVIVDNIAIRYPGSYRYVGHSDKNPVAILYVPMIADERVLGVIQAQSVREGAYTEEDVALLAIIANQAAMAILKARLYRDAVEGRLAMERANRIKDEFLATLSHELRTPLTPILGWTQILSRIGPDDKETLLHAVSVIERNARFQARLVNDLLDMSRIESGKLSISPQPSDLNLAVISVVDGLRTESESRDIDISTSLASQPVIVSADPARLEQIINNLLANAFKFTEEGGRITISTERRNDSAVLVCTDTGIGIELDFLPYVFDRFRQADSSTRRQHAGLGLGLSIVKSLVEMHGGKIEARSKGPGHGSTFVVELPLAEADAVVAGQSADGTKTAIAGLRALIVEDDADSLEMMRALCEGRGLSVTGARTAEEALELAASCRPDIIISDISLPEADGLELARRLRADARFRNTPMIALSGLFSDEDRDRALAAGFDLHLGKPVAYETLINALRQALIARTALEK
jgi:signal transduction histidine kinase/ActR/RegA family two-component response regulator